MHARCCPHCGQPIPDTTPALRTANENRRTLGLEPLPSPPQRVTFAELWVEPFDFNGEGHE